MKRLILEPVGWPLPLEEMTPGLFIISNRNNSEVFFKDEYGHEYCVESGEYFCATDRDKMIVQPVECSWKDF